MSWRGRRDGIETCTRGRIDEVSLPLVYFVVTSSLTHDSNPPFSYLSFSPLARELARAASLAQVSFVACTVLLLPLPSLSLSYSTAFHVVSRENLKKTAKRANVFKRRGEPSQLALSKLFPRELTSYLPPVHADEILEERT